jgi:Leucine-rich repeat (LRR) protein
MNNAIKRINECIKYNHIKLDLSNLNLNIFPKQLEQCKNINYLDISNNNITEIPDYIEHIKHLKILNVSNNNIEKISQNIGECKLLEFFYCNFNSSNLINIPDTLNNCFNIKTILFDKNVIINNLNYFTK